MTRIHLFVLPLALLLASCGNDQPEPKAPPAPQGQQQQPAEDHEHGPPHELGKLDLSGHQITVTQFGEVTPGAEISFDFDFPAGQPLPQALRGWLGSESALGSRKVRFEKETDTRMHGHIEAPKVMPEGGKLWLEVETKEGPVRGSLAYWK